MEIDLLMVVDVVVVVTGGFVKLSLAIFWTRALVVKEVKPWNELKT